MRKCLIIIIIIFPEVSISQTISGILLDKKTNNPISFAHIYAKKYNLGIITNELGEFEITLPDLDNEFVLSISHISYNPVEVQVKHDTTLQVFMESDIIQLKNVIIGDKAYEIAKEVMYLLENAETVYGKAFFRQITMQDTVPTEFIESFYHVAYSQKGVQKVAVDQARFARKKVQGMPYFFFTNFSYTSVGFKIFSEEPSPVMKPFSPLYFDNYQFGIIDEYSKGSDNYVVVEFTPDETNKSTGELINLKGQFTYNISSKTLIEYKADVHHSLGADQIRFNGDLKLSASDPFYQWTISFSNRNGVHGIYFMLVEYNFNLVMDDTSVPTTVSSKMIFYEKSDKPYKKLREPGVALEDVSIFEKAKYRPLFWKNNPVIKRTPSEEAIIRSFEKENAFGSYFKNK
jgi:hypothetical protein